MLSSGYFLLTQSETFIIGDLAKLFGFLMNLIYNFFGSTFGFYSLGFSIIVFTIITRLLMLPLAFKQQKSMKETQLIQPELKKIQDKYKGKKDQESQQKMQAETAALYQKHGVNPLGGCLPVLIQMPIIFSLFQVLRNIPAYISNIKLSYTDIVNQIYTVDGFADKLQSIMDTEAILKVSKFDANVVDKVIDLLYKFQTETWAKFYEIFPSIQSSVEVTVDQLNKVYSMFGINLADNPDMLSIGVLIPVLNVAAQFISTKISMSKSTATMTDQQAQTNKTMMYTMPLLSGFFAISMPAGLGLYWLAGSVFQIAQTMVINHHIHKEDTK